MHAVDQRGALGFQRFGGGDVRLDHEFFDELVRVQPFRRDNALNHAMGIEDEFALRQVQFQRPARIAGFHDGVVGRPEGLQGRFEQGLGLGVR